MIARYLRLKFKNVPVAFDPLRHAAALEGYSYAEIERVCTQAVKSMIIDRRKQVQERDFNRAVDDEARRRAGQSRLSPPS
jgi:ATP-dependent 26S proteasome regulatory subunit